MKQDSVIAVVERFAPPQIAASWDRSGLQVAAPRDDISHLVLCLDPSPESLSLALDMGADMILSHHPLSMSPRFPNEPGPWLTSLTLLLSRRVPLYAAHTSLDANPHGPVAWLADELGLGGRTLLENTAPLPDGSMGGFGLAGDLPRPMRLAEITAVMAAFMPLQSALMTGPAPMSIERLAISPGSGSSLLDAARSSGAQLFISGDIKYHGALDNAQAALQLDENLRLAPGPALAVLDVGHFGLEEEMMRRFALALQPLLEGVRVTFLPGKDPYYPLSEVPEVLL